MVTKIRKLTAVILSLVLIIVSAIGSRGVAVSAADAQIAPEPVSNLVVQDYYKYTGKYIIYFNAPKESSGYNVYIDDQKKPVKKIKSAGEYVSSEDLKGYSNGNHTLYVANVNGGGIESEMQSVQFTIKDTAGTYTDIPQVYIYTTQEITQEYHKDADVTVSVVDEDGGEYGDLFDSTSNIKIRGNSTAAASKKPWNIKFGSKQSVLGMDKGKKWCLLANYFDKAQMRNSLSYDFALQNGVTYTSQSRYADVYQNGRFWGNYLITEPVEAKKERVDIDAYDAESNDILLELGTRYEPDVDHFTTDTLKTTFDVNDPEKGDDLTDAEVDQKIARVKSYLNEFECALVGQNYDEILNYIDEDTFVNFYIVNEFFKNVDFNFSSTRFYIKNDKIYAGPLWDLDLSSGNCSSINYKDYYVDGVSYKGYYCQTMNWYRELVKNETFYNKVKTRYKELQYVIQNIYKTDSNAELSINALVDKYGTSFERNFAGASGVNAGWSVSFNDGLSYAGESGWTNWKDPIEFLRNWLENRNAWLCGEWEIDMAAAYEESKPDLPEEPTTPDLPEEPTTPDLPEEPTTPDLPEEPSTPDLPEEPTTLEVTEPESTISQKPAEPTTPEVTSKKSTVKVGKTKVKSAKKKLSEKRVKLSLKRIKGVKGYQIKITQKKGKKVLVKKVVKKLKVTIKSKKIRNKKKLYIRARAFKIVNGKRKYGKWSTIKKVRITK